MVRDCEDSPNQGTRCSRRRAGKIFGTRRSLGDGDVPRSPSRKGANCSFVTSVASIQKPSTKTRCTGLGLSRGLHADRVVRVAADPARPSRIHRRESTPCRRAQALAADSSFSTVGRNRFDVAASAAGSALSAAGLGRVAAKATTAAAAIVTTAAHVHARLPRRGRDPVLCDFERRLLDASVLVLNLARRSHARRTAREIPWGRLGFGDAPAPC